MHDTLVRVGPTFKVLLVTLATPTSWYRSNGALSPLLIGPFPRIRHIQTSAVVCVLLSPIFCFLCTHRAVFHPTELCFRSFSHKYLSKN